MGYPMFGGRIGSRFLIVAVLHFIVAIVVSVQAEQFPRLLITDKIDESKLVTLGGNTRPEAKAKYDRGAMPTDFRLEHLWLLLKRSPEQERDLQHPVD
jgi:hypothetical protein